MVTPSQDQNEPITFVHYGCLENSDLRPQTSPKLSPPNLENSDLENLDPPPPPPTNLLWVPEAFRARFPVSVVLKSDPHEKPPVAPKQMTHISFSFWTFGCGSYEFACI